MIAPHYKNTLFILIMLILPHTLQAMESPDELGPEIDTLFKAVGSGIIERVEQALEHCSINARDKNGSTCLHVASKNGHSALVSFLLEHGADVNCRDKDGVTPLHRASAQGHILVMQLLLDQHANIQANEAVYGTTPLHGAIFLGQYDAAQLLIQHGAYVDKRDHKGHTPLTYAAKKGDLRCAQMLLDAGAHVDVLDKENGDALGHACFNQHKEMIRFLIQHGSPFDLSFLTKPSLIPGHVHRVRETFHDHPLVFAALLDDLEKLQQLVETLESSAVSDKDLQNHICELLLYALGQGNNKVISLTKPAEPPKTLDFLLQLIERKKWPLWQFLNNALFHAARAGRDESVSKLIRFLSERGQLNPDFVRVCRELVYAHSALGLFSYRAHHKRIIPLLCNLMLIQMARSGLVMQKEVRCDGMLPSFFSLLPPELIKLVMNFLTGAHLLNR